jgi:adenylate cyclase
MTLRTKLNLLIAATALLVGIVAAAIIHPLEDQRRKHTIEQIRYTMIAIVDYHADEIAANLRHQQGHGMSYVVEDMLTFGGLLSVNVYDASGEYVYSPDGTGGELSEQERASVAQGGTFEEGQWYGLPVLRYLVPIQSETQTEGYLTLYYTLEDVANDFYAVLTAVALLLVAVSAVLFLILNLLLSRIVLQPIQLLRRGIQSMKEGHVGETIQMRREDEFGDLAHAFNSMTKEIAALQHNLEDKVAQRTASLQRALETTMEQELEISHLNQVSHIVNSTLDLNEIMKTVKEVLHKRIKFDLLLVQVFSQHQDLLEHLYSSGESIVDERAQASLENVFLPVRAEGVFAEVVRSQKPRSLPDVASLGAEVLSPLEQSLVQTLKTRSLLLYPLIVQHRCFGVMTFGQTSASFPSSERAISVVEQYVLQVSTAIHNALLYQNLRTTQIQLEESERIARLTRTFEKFVPRQLLSRLSKTGLENIEFGHADRDFITVLFSDIRSFTTISEQMDPQELMNFLNAFLQHMSEPIHANYGCIDKFVGDAVMALFDVPEDSDEFEAECAVRSAIGMQQALAAFNAQRRQQQLTEIEAGIGIHSGHAIIGTVGSESRMDSTVIGDTVNLASRVESLTKMYGVPILMTGSTLRLLNNVRDYKIREIDWVQVKGKRQPVELYELYDMEPPDVQALKQRSGVRILRGLSHRRKKEWDAAQKYFARARDVYPEDPVPVYHLQQLERVRVSEYAKSASWNGAVLFQNK